MEETQFPYHKVIQEKLVRSTLIPVALLGMALIVITPFLLVFLLWQQVNYEAYLASQAVSVPLKEYIEGMKQLQSDPQLISFLTSGEHSIEAYERLYQFRNEQSIFAYFQLENEQYSAAQMPAGQRQPSASLHSGGGQPQFRNCRKHQHGDRIVCRSYPVHTVLPDGRGRSGYLVLSFYRRQSESSASAGRCSFDAAQRQRSVTGQYRSDVCGL